MIAWDPKFATPFESPWGLIQKLSWMNHIKPVHVIRLLTDAHIPESGEPDAPSRRLVDASWMANHHINDDVISGNGLQGAFPELVTSLCARDGKHQFGRFANALLSPRWVRFCPKCVQLGYHSIVHQIRSLERCPIHHTLLIERCPACRKPMPWFGIGKASIGWRCGDCGASWLGGDDTLCPTSDIFRNEIEKTIGSIMQWIQSLLKLPYNFYKHDFDNRFENFLRTSAYDERAYTSYADASMWFLHEICHFPLNTFILQNKPIGLRHVASGEFLKMGTEPKISDLNKIYSYTGLVQYASQYIERHISIKHARCLDDCKSLDVSGPTYEERCRLGVGLCPVAHAYLIWRKSSLYWAQRVSRSIYDSTEVDYILGPGSQKRYLEWNCLLSSYYAWVHSVILMQSWFKCKARFYKNIFLPSVELNTNPWLRKYFSIPYAQYTDLPKASPQVVLEDFDAINCSRCDQGVSIRAWLEQRWLDKIMRYRDFMDDHRSNK